MGNLRDDVERMKRELAQKQEQLARQERDCRHQFGAAQYDPEEYQDAVYSHLEGHGSDPHPVYNYVTRHRDRWSRTCAVCGKTEYTKTQKAVKHEPDFG